MNPFTSRKIFRFPDRLASIIDGRPCPPVTIELDLTNRCNHRCPECAGMRTHAAELSAGEAEAYLHQIRHVGAKGVIFTGGGEPLCHPDAARLCMKARAIGLDVGFITNGGLLTEERIKMLVDSCTWIRVSLDASDPETFKRTHGRSADEFNRVMRNIEALARYKASSRASCTIGVGYLADEQNRDGIPALAKHLASVGVDYLQVRPFHWRPADVSRQLEEARQFETDSFRVVSSADKYANANAEREYTYCYGSEVCGVIQADSGVPLCCHLRGKHDYIIGYLRDGVTFEDLWYGKRKRDILARLDVSRCVPLCRCDGINRLLHQISQKVDHQSFL